MATGYASRGPIVRENTGAEEPLGEMLRLLSTGASGAILLALDEGAMQTKVLTQRIRGYTARTVYRYLPRLAQAGAVERDDRPGGPARVVHTLSQRGGNELCDLINRFATASMTHLPGGQIEPRAWAALGLLADFWEAGVVDELSQGPRSLAELARRLEALSYHQLNRRASRLEAFGFFGESGRVERRGYVLTDKARRTMGLIAGLGRWRRRHLAGEGLSVAEMTTVLRVSLPLARLPHRPGKTMRVTVKGGAGDSPRELWAEVGGDGAVAVAEAGVSACDCWAEGSVDNWMAALIDGKPPARSGGDAEMVSDCLTSLYEKLWSPSPF
ncbi:MAG TPA: winged helix-turn-helix transcriptional regulator [Solirubrobacterales bacterium]